jgi:hypothetical protein
MRSLFRKTVQRFATIPELPQRRYVRYSTLHFICRPSDSTVSEDAGIKPRTVAMTALATRRLTSRLDLIHSRLDLSRLDLIHSRLDLSRLDLILCTSPWMRSSRLWMGCREDGFGQQEECCIVGSLPKNLKKRMKVLRVEENKMATLASGFGVLGIFSVRCSFNLT